MKLVKAGTQRREKVIRKGHVFLGGKSHDDKTEIKMKSWQYTQDTGVEVGVGTLFGKPYIVFNEDVNKMFA